MKIANLSLLPKVKAATPETLIVANGFSCREQIEGLPHRGTLHLADVLARGAGVERLSVKVLAISDLLPAVSSSFTAEAVNSSLYPATPFQTLDQGLE